MIFVGSDCRVLVNKYVNVLCKEDAGVLVLALW
jgi:hypothetical protein